MDPRRLAVPFFAVALSLAALGCGREEEEVVASAPPTADEAIARRAQVEQEVAALRQIAAETAQAQQAAEAKAESAQAELEEAREAGNQARNALRDAEQKLAALQPPPPSDEEVFRRVQKTLLEAPALAQVAIAAEVSRRSVTLRGSVPDDATRDAAVEIARAVDGVAEVHSELQVAD
jgi:osmotically-inducible protein OsmY